MSKETCKVIWSKSFVKAGLPGRIPAGYIGSQEAYATEV